MNRSIDPHEAALLRLSGEGRFSEVMKLGGSRLTDPTQSCLSYELLAKAAARTGSIGHLADQFRDLVRESPGEDLLLVGYAFALQELHADEQAFSLLASVVRRGPPCQRVTEAFLDVSQRVGRLRDAEELLSQLLATRPTDGFLLFAWAYLWDLRGDAGRALTAYQDAIFKGAPSALTYLHYSRLLINTGQFERAFFASRIGIQIAQDSLRPETLTALLASAGITLDWLERDRESEQAFQQALVVAREYNLFPLEVGILLGRANLARSRGRMDVSLTYLREARAREGRIFVPRDRAAYLDRLGRTLTGLGRQEEARAAFRESLLLARADNRPGLELESQINLALDLGEREIGSALSSLRAALQRAEELEDGRLQSRALLGLGALHERMGNYRLSLQFYQQALGLIRRADDRRAEAIALGNIGLVHFRSNLPSQALLYSARALQLARSLKNLSLEARLLQGFAAALAGLGNFQQSERLYREAKDVASKLSAPGLEALVVAGWARIVLELGRTQDAKEGFEEALDLARSTDSTLVRVQALFGLGQCHRREGDLNQARDRFEQALEVVESFRQNIGAQTERMSYLETRAQIYASLASVLVELDRLKPEEDYREQAFQVVERSRSRALLDTLLASGGETEEARAHLRTAAGGHGSLTSASIRSRVLQDDELFLEFALGNSGSYLWALSRDDFIVASLPPRRAIEKLSRSFLETIASPPRAPANTFGRHLPLAAELFDVLLAPVRPLLSQARHLIVSPDGILHHLPFEALTTPGGRGTPRYLLAMTPISYVPSASVLAWLRARPRSEGPPLEFLGVAHPGGWSMETASGQEGQGGLGATDLPAIPFASAEVQGVAGLFASSKRRIYLGSEASERVIKKTDLRRFRIVHFAAHAASDEIFPERSAIYLAPDKTGVEDGVLRMGEVLDLSLASDLVVLSGCRTGVGQVLRAEGTVGFTWAFLSAGSSSLVVSRWNVNDRSTSELMQSFYQQMAGGESRAAALRKAKQSLLNSERKAYHHPYYWAPFVLVGLGQ
jgi:CHAT domain-containing protein/tetratricopeptide (TPR) repeat protein